MLPAVPGPVPSRSSSPPHTAQADRLVTLVPLASPWWHGINAPNALQRHKLYKLHACVCVSGPCCERDHYGKEEQVRTRNRLTESLTLRMRTKLIAETLPRRREASVHPTDSEGWAGSVVLDEPRNGHETRERGLSSNGVYVRSCQFGLSSLCIQDLHKPMSAASCSKAAGRPIAQSDPYREYMPAQRPRNPPDQSTTMTRFSRLLMQHETKESLGGSARGGVHEIGFGEPLALLLGFESFNASFELGVWWGISKRWVCGMIGIMADLAQRPRSSRELD